MITFRKQALALAVLGALTVTGCGSSSTSSDSKASAGVKRTGVITGFGSVYVNGVKYKTETAQAEDGGICTMSFPPVCYIPVTVEDKKGNMDDLAIGMVVTLEGSVNVDGKTGVATQIEYADELEGVVSAVNLAADGTGTLTVMGQTVKVSAMTTFASKVQSITSITQVMIDNIVEVSGYSAGDGNIVATRVEVKKAKMEAGDEIEVKGVISKLNETAGPGTSSTKTFMLGALMVHYDTAEVEGPLANGLYVEVKSDQAPVNNMLIATKVEVEGDGKKGVDGEAGDEFELEGVVSAVNSTSEFVLNGQIVLIDSGTEFENGSSATITVDAMLEVEGTLNADGKLVADEIEFRNESSIEIKAALQAIDTTASTITVLGQTVTVNAQTIMDAEHEICTMSMPPVCTVVNNFSLNSLKLNDWVKLHIALSNGKLVATKLEHEDGSVDASAKVQLKGPVSAITGTQATIAGIKVELGTLLATTLKVGDALVVSGLFANGVLTASAAEITD